MKLVSECALLAALLQYGPHFQAAAAITGPAPASFLWHDPGRVERLDMAGGPGGSALRPQPPFRYLGPLASGTSLKVRVRDARGREWIVKWGAEVKAETFASRIAWACGYFTRPAYFVDRGVIGGMPPGSGSRFDEDGSFKDARFQAWDENIALGHNWSWSYNPFIGTHQLNGLKILVMLISDWDDKDARNVDLGSNTAIQEFHRAGHTEYRYLITDWGGSMGKVGVPAVGRSKWDCEGFTEQTTGFIRGVKDGVVEWGFKGTNNEVRDGISVEDVRWLLQYLGRITDRQLALALRASGATATEADCFKAAVRRRIDALGRIAKAGTTNRRS